MKIQGFTAGIVPLWLGRRLYKIYKKSHLAVRHVIEGKRATSTDLLSCALPIKGNIIYSWGSIENVFGFGKVPDLFVIISQLDPTRDYEVKAFIHRVECDYICVYDHSLDVYINIIFPKCDGIDGCYFNNVMAMKMPLKTHF